MAEPEKRKPWVTVKNTLIAPSFKLVGTLFSFAPTIMIAGTVAVGGFALVAYGDAYDPFSSGTPLQAQQEPANILQEINGKLDLIIESGGFPPGPPEFIEQLNEIEERTLCIADLLDGRDITCGD